MTPAAPLPVTVVGGYLGAGKTTLVNSLLRQANGRRLAIMVNEFGALPIDASLVEAADERIVSLVGGCVCCSYGEDLVSSLTMLEALEPRPDHVLLEASGVAFPGAIAGTVGLLQGFALDGAVVLADAETVRERAGDRYLGSTVRRQLAEADLILLNKCDLAGDADEVEAWLGGTAPEARLLRTVRSEAPIDIVLGAWTGRAPLPAAGGPFDHTHGYATAALDPPEGAEPEALARTLADPAHALLRAKGFIRRPGGGMAAIQTVGSRWAVSDAPADAPAGLVCIGLEEQTDFAALRRAFGLAAPDADGRRSGALRTSPVQPGRTGF